MFAKYYQIFKETIMKCKQPNMALRKLLTFNMFKSFGHCCIDVSCESYHISSFYYEEEIVKLLIYTYINKSQRLLLNYISLMEYVLGHIVHYVQMLSAVYFRKLPFVTFVYVCNPSDRSNKLQRWWVTLRIVIYRFFVWFYYLFHLVTKTLSPFVTGILGSSVHGNLMHTLHPLVMGNQAPE